MANDFPMSYRQQAKKEISDDISTTWPIFKIGITQKPYERKNLLQQMKEQHNDFFKECFLLIQQIICNNLKCYLLIVDEMCHEVPSFIKGSHYYPFVIICVFAF